MQTLWRISQRWWSKRLWCDIWQWRNKSVFKQFWCRDWRYSQYWQKLVNNRSMFFNYLIKYLLNFVLTILEMCMIPIYFFYPFTIVNLPQSIWLDGDFFYLTSNIYSSKCQVFFAPNEVQIKMLGEPTLCMPPKLEQNPMFPCSHYKHL